MTMREMIRERKVKTKALVLFSGGLDSILAVKVLEAQGIEVTAITFESNFYNANKAKISAQQLGIELKIVDISSEMLKLVKNPPSGHGKCLNPCIDCHALMIKESAKFLKEETKFLSTEATGRDSVSGDRYDIIATGEVLGQRPFSQNKEALERVKNLAGVEVLRPLSAKLLAETEYGKKGLVDRRGLLDIQGRRRECQIELAKKFGVKEYPSPGGGCMLTEAEFSDRLRYMINYWSDCDVNDAELLRHGRVFWINKETLIVVGRSEEDNENLKKLARKGNVLVELVDLNGPVTLIRIKNEKLKMKNEVLEFQIPVELNVKDLKLDNEKSDEEILETACLLTGWYATKARGGVAEFKVESIK